MVKPAFPKVKKPDLTAIFKRATIVVNTKKYFYLKLAAEINAIRMPITSPKGCPCKPFV